MRRKAYRITHAISGALLATAFVAIAFGTGTFVVLQTHALPASNAAAAITSMQQLNPGPLLAQAAIVYDPSDGEVLYQKNADAALPLASITKLMTADIILSTEPPDTSVTLTRDDLAVVSDTADKEFHIGDTLPLSDLIQFGLIASSNVAIQAAAESLGSGYLDRMNDVAQSLGFSKTHFNNPTGLDINESTSGAYSSAYDVGRLAALFYRQYPKYFESTQRPNVSLVVDGRTLQATATGAPLLSLPGFVGAKTGYTDLAGGNIVAVFDIEIGHPLVAVVLGSTADGRFSDIKSLITAAQNRTP
jgi:D-alanyl-D-alanine carboxypeptidase